MRETRIALRLRGVSSSLDSQAPRGAWRRVLVVASFFALATPFEVVAAQPDSGALASLLRKGRYAEADSLGKLWLDRVESRGADSLAVADALDLWNEAHRRAGRGRGADALESCERAVRIRTQLLGDSDPRLAPSLQNLGMYHYSRSELGEARPCFERALTLHERANPPDSAGWGRSLLYLAAFESASGEDAKALDLVERALRIQSATLPPLHSDLGLSHEMLGGIQYRRGDYAGAADEYRSALAIARASTGERSLQTAAAMHNLGGVVHLLGDLREAERLYRASLSIRTGLLGRDHRLVSSSLQNLAFLEEDTGHLGRALREQREAVSILERQREPEGEAVASALAHLSNLERRSGHPAAALAAGMRGVGLYESILGPAHPHTVDAVTTLALAEEAAGRRLTADSLLQEALRADRPIPFRGRALVHLTAATIHLGRGRDSLALDFALRAEVAGRAHFLQTAERISEREGLGYGSVRSGGLGCALAAAVRRPITDLEAHALADAIIRSRILVLETMGMRLRNDGDRSDPGLAAAIDSLRAARRDLARLVVRGPATASAEPFELEYEAARNRVDRRERELGALSPVSRAEQERLETGVDAVAASLPAGSSLVAFVRIERDPASSVYARDGRYFALVLAASGAVPRIQDLGPAAPIDRAVLAWRAEIERGGREGGSTRAAEERCRAAGRDVRRLLWDPLVARPPAGSRVFLVPDGPIALVNLAALPAGEDRYLVDSCEVHRLGSERDLAVSPRSSGLGTLLAIGNPEFEASATPARRGIHDRGSARPKVMRGLGRLRFSPLPESVREVDAITRVWEQSGGTTDRLTGANANERSFKKEAPRAAVIHIASHGFFLEGREGRALPSRRGIGRMSGSAWALASAPPEAFRLSGIALAGANARDRAPSGEEDGVLTADEIATLDLHNARWAVLSGCDTGVGTVQTGEGVLGLERSFRIAGVRTVIMSLWEVEDAAARRWMTSLYDARFREGRATIDAVQDACRSVLSDRRVHGRSTHPFTWAAFVASGDWR